MTDKETYAVIVVLLLIVVGTAVYLFATSQQAVIYNFFNYSAQPQTISPLPQTGLSCASYDIGAEYTRYFGPANMAAIQQTCINNGGAWVSRSNQVSCHFPNAISLDCSQNYFTVSAMLCNALKATPTCSNITKFAGCLCNLNPPAAPLDGLPPNGNENVPNGGESCGWKTITGGLVCAGTCPEGEVCKVVDSACACHTAVHEGNIFLSSLTWNGAMGGVTGAAQKCQNMAYYAGKAGTWVAVLSSSISSIRYALPDTEYYKMDGTLVAISSADLFDGTIASPIDIDETGAKHISPYHVWTGSDANGNGLASNCHEWGWVSATGTSGLSVATDGRWINDFASDCGTGQKIYCARII